MMEVKDGRIASCVLYPTLHALVAKQPNKRFLTLFHSLVLVSIIALLAPKCSLI